MSGVTVEFDEAQLRKFLNFLENSNNLSAPLKASGEYLLRRHKQRWDAQVSSDGTAWSPLKPDYATSPAKMKSRGAGKILTLGGYLKKLQYQLEGNTFLIGTNLIYGATHQFGRPEKNIPARPFLGVSDEDTEEISQIFLDWINSR